MENISNIKDILKRTAFNFKDKTAYIVEEKNITFSNLLDDVNSIGTMLYNLGLKNKRIGIISENRYEWEMSYFAVVCGENIAVPIDKTLPYSEIERIVKIANINAVIYSDAYEEHILKLKLNNKIDYAISMDNKNNTTESLSLKKLLSDGKTLVQNGDTSYTNENIKESEIAQIIFTSGTTDTSKAVALTHKNICTNIMSSASVMDMTNKDIILSILPLNHVLEGLFSLLLSVYNGATRIFCKSSEEILSDIKKYNVTIMCGVPALYSILYDLLKDDENIEKVVKNINFFFCAGAMLNESLKEKYKKIGITLLQGYGLTETSGAVALERKDSSVKNTVGKVIPNVNVKIKNDEILVSGDTVMLGYYNDEKSDKDALDNGWLLTGDIGSIDSQGYISITGRKKEMIALKNGKKIFPSEIEEKIDSIEGVRESIVYTIKNSAGEESAVSAKIVCSNKDKKNIEESIQKLNLDLSEYKKIRNIEFTEKELIRNSNGKIDRKTEIDIISRNNLGVEEQNGQNSKENIIKSIISSQLNINENEINPETNIVHELGADSLDKVSIILKVEKRFNVKIAKDERKNMNTLKDILTYIEKEV